MQKRLLLLSFLVLVLAGCATSSRYVSYTLQNFPAKDKLYSVNVYPLMHVLPASNPYYVIGQVTIQGFVGNGVRPETLTNEAKEIARKRGADAIINASTEAFHYYGGDALLRFKGELIVYAPAAAK